MSQYGDPVFGTVFERFPVVETTHGRIVGEASGGVAAFRGVPYGGRCDRERRFRPAVEADGWSGVRDCTQNGPICVQLANQSSAQDENCLYLSVLTPGLDRAQRPVMVYLHGGGYGKSSGELVLRADRLAREQDVVLVGVNHRLHVFGYLYLGELDAQYQDSGNVGHLDMIMALRWVRDNIEAFGGDPGRVMIIGESGGSDKVNAMLRMPEARGLFHRAISISGSLPVGRLTKARATEHALQALRLLDVSPKDLSKLRELPARHITSVILGHFWDMTFIPVADGVHLQACAGDGFEPAPGSADIPVMMGSSEDEMGCFSADISMDVTEQNLRAKLLERAGMFDLCLNEANVDEAIDVFRRRNARRDTAEHMFIKMVSVGSYLSLGAFYQAQSFVRAGKKRVFLYLNRYDAPHPSIPNRRYAYHCMDLNLGLRIVEDPELEAYSKTLSSIYGALMRSGAPSTRALPWMPFDEQGEQTMVFDKTFHMESNPLRDEVAVLERVNGRRSIVNPFLYRSGSLPY